MVEQFWRYAKYWVRAAVDKTDLMTVREIEEAVLAGRSLLWLAFNERQQVLGAVTTELRRTELSLSCIITSCAGNLPPNWPALLAKIEDYARAEGCGYVRVYGRRGWARKLKGRYVQQHVVLERQLT